MYGTAWKKEATKGLVEKAVEAGFTAIDTANQLRHYYEIGVGEALQELAKKGIKRESLFLQTKFTSLDGQGDHTPYDRKADLTTQVINRSTVRFSICTLMFWTLTFCMVHLRVMDSVIPIGKSGQRLKINTRKAKQK